LPEAKKEIVETSKNLLLKSWMGERPLSTDLANIKTRLISSLDLGEAIIPKAIFENPNGTPVELSTDYFNEKRVPHRNKVGLFSKVSLGYTPIKLWPKQTGIQGFGNMVF
jgi:hypothetical protein